MVDNGSHGENASQNADNVDEQAVPIVMRVDLQNCHWVSFISILITIYLKYTIGNWFKITSFNRAV